MQNLIKYTQFFKPSKIDIKTLSKFKGEFEEFDAYYKANIPINRLGYIIWAYGYNSYDHLYNTLLKELADYLSVKVMFKDQLNTFDQPVEGYFFIGDEFRICILNYLWDYVIDIFIQYKKLIKSPRKRAALGISSLTFKELVMNMSAIVNGLLVTDINYEYYIEKYIQNHFKLDYKNYNQQENHYDHAISAKYYNGRLLL